MNQPIQQGLFDHRKLNTGIDQKIAMHNAVKNCKLSREEVVDKLNALAAYNGISLTGNGKISLAIFEKWINPNDKTRHMPIRVLPLFCAVTGDITVLDIIARAVGGRAIDIQEAKLLEWAKLHHRIKADRKKMRQLEKEIGGNYGG